jgi:hypothetical protein
MKTRIPLARAIFAVLAVLAWSAAPYQARAADPPGVVAASGPAATLATMRWLVGGTWTCDGKTLPGGLDRIETKYDLSPNGRVIRFTTAFVMPDGSIPNGYAGNFYVDPATNGLRGWYLSSSNEETQGAVSGDEQHWAMSFKSDGSVVGRPGMMDFKADVTRTSQDSYDWKLLAYAGDTWRPVFALTYRRSAPKV